MLGLSGARLLEVWESGRTGSVAERALTLLALVRPTASRPDHAATPIGARNRALLEAYRTRIGPTLDGVDRCPRCGAQVEVSVPAAALLPLDGHPETTGTLARERLTVRFRALDGDDLSAAEACATPEQARAALIARCVLAVEIDGRPATADALDETAIADLSDAMAAHDPHAEIILRLDCPDCRHGWSATLDVAAHLWSELDGRARRLLAEVHTLASVYHWSETEILAMTEERRAGYLALVGRAR